MSMLNAEDSVFVKTFPADSTNMDATELEVIAPAMVSILLFNRGII